MMTSILTRHLLGNTLFHEVKPSSGSAGRINVESTHLPPFLTTFTTSVVVIGTKNSAPTTVLRHPCWHDEKDCDVEGFTWLHSHNTFGFRNSGRSWKKVTTERRVLDLSPHAGSDSIQPFFKIYPLVDEHTHTRGVKTNLRMKSLSTFPPFMEWNQEK